MRIKGRVRCQYWNRSEPFEFDMPDNSTEAEIEEALREAALEVSGFEFWKEDDVDSLKG